MNFHDTSKFHVLFGLMTYQPFCFKVEKTQSRQSLLRCTPLECQRSLVPASPPNCYDSWAPFFGEIPGNQQAGGWLNAALARPKCLGIARVFAEEANNKLIFPLFFSKMLICRSDQSGPLYQPILETSSASYTDLKDMFFEQLPNDSPLKNLDIKVCWPNIWDRIQLYSQVRLLWFAWNLQ